MIKDITIKFTDGNTAVAFPNPTMDHTVLMFSSPVENTTQLEITNAQGNVIHTLTVAAGTDRVELDLSRWQAGYYFIYSTEQGFRQLVNKIIKAVN